MNIKKEKLMYAILFIIGLIVLILGTAVVKVANFDNLIEVMSGLGGAWIGISGIKLYQIKRKPEKYKEEIIKQYDERNIKIKGYAGYATFIISLLTISIDKVRIIV